jgi:hypothetical protein
MYFKILNRILHNPFYFWLFVFENVITSIKLSFRPLHRHDYIRVRRIFAMRLRFPDIFALFICHASDVKAPLAQKN